VMGSNWSLWLLVVFLRVTTLAARDSGHTTSVDVRSCSGNEMLSSGSRCGMCGFVFATDHHSRVCVGRPCGILVEC
jgi:hypothetical protein